MKSLILASLLLACMVSCAVAQKKVVCYWGTWAAYRLEAGKFENTNINPNICTHIIYSFFGVSTAGLVTYLDTNLDLPINNDYINKFIALKSQNPNVKLMAAIGGWNFGSATFSAVAASATLRTAFANSAVAFTQLHGFDGIDIDWEYPAQRGGSPSDKANFVLLLQALKTALSAQGKLLSVAVAASSISASISYDIPNVSANVDFINLMTYDLHSAWDSNTGINAPLFQGPESRSDLNVAACISYWLGQGAPAAKLIVGIPTYGISFTLANSANNGLGAAAIGAGTAGTFTKQPGFLGYYEICAAGWTRVPQSAQKVPYAFSGNQWVGYDDVESVSVKSNYIVSNNLGGSMFWSIETDDFRGNCGGGSFPLITASYNIIMNSVAVSTTAAATTTTTKAPTTIAVVTTTSAATTTKATTTTTKAPNTTATTTASSTVVCGTVNGYIRDPTNCAVFYQCYNGQRYQFACASGLVFDTTINACNWPSSVTC